MSPALLQPSRSSPTVSSGSSVEYRLDRENTAAWVLFSATVPKSKVRMSSSATEENDGLACANCEKSNAITPSQSAVYWSAALFNPWLMTSVDGESVGGPTGEEAPLDVPESLQGGETVVPPEDGESLPAPRTRVLDDPERSPAAALAPPAPSRVRRELLMAGAEGLVVVTTAPPQDVPVDDAVVPPDPRTLPVRVRVSPLDIPRPISSFVR